MSSFHDPFKKTTVPRTNSKVKEFDYFIETHQQKKRQKKFGQIVHPVTFLVLVRFW